MAEGLMRHKCKEEGRNDMTVSSMGIHGLNDYSAMPKKSVKMTALTSHLTRRDIW